MGRVWNGDVGGCERPSGDNDDAAGEGGGKEYGRGGADTTAG